MRANLVESMPVKIYEIILDWESNLNQPIKDEIRETLKFIMDIQDEKVVVKFLGTDYQFGSKAERRAWVWGFRAARNISAEEQKRALP